MPPDARPAGEYESAVRHASWLLLLTGLTAFLGIAPQPDRWLLLVTQAAVAFAIAAGIRLVPPHAWGARGMTALVAVIFLALGVSTWAAGERATMTGPGIVLGFVWLGLHRPIRTVLLCVPLAGVVYALALLAVDTPAESIGSVLPLVSIAGLVGVIISQNVTSLKRAEAATKAQERWRAAIMATLAHDVRAPLTSITGALEIVTEDPDTPAASRPLLAAAGRQASRIMRLATGLLEVERVDQGRLRLDTYDVELLGLLQDIVESQPSAPFELDVEPGLLVWADRERLEQILVNLLGNAARHGSPPVVVTAAAGPLGTTICVRDHGKGVPAGSVSGLFDRLGATSSNPQSVGLGLWIVRLLCEAHGGSVHYEDAAPGARFVVRLPGAPEHVELPGAGNDSQTVTIATRRPATTTDRESLRVRH